MREKDAIMDEWRVAQIFLSDTGVHEVLLHMKSSKGKCDCPGYSSRSTCKHVKYVQNRMADNHGVYPVEISSKASTADTYGQLNDPALFRKLILKYGKIEVL